MKSGPSIFFLPAEGGASVRQTQPLSGKKDLRYKVFLSRRVCVVLQYCKNSRQYCHSCPDAFLQFGQISPLPYTEPAQPVRGYSLIRDVQSHHTAILHEIPLLNAVPHMHTISQYGEVIILGYCITALSVLLYWGILENTGEYCSILVHVQCCGGIYHSAARLTGAPGARTHTPRLQLLAAALGGAPGLARAS